MNTDDGKQVRLAYVAIFTLVMALALYINDQILYKHFIVPHLQELPFVPFHWWIGALSPIFLTLFVAGILIKSWNELILLSGTLGIARQAYEFIVAQLLQPGHLTSHALEAPFVFWTIDTVTIILLFFVMLLTIWIITKWLAKQYLNV